MTAGGKLNIFSGASELTLLLVPCPQKERDHAREAKWKLEEIKTKVNTLRTQKRGLDNRMLEMQTTISSLREEQKTIELVLEDKQNEIKLMRERYTEISNPQAKGLSEIIMQKKSEAEDLKNRLEIPVKVWSVSTDDPSNASVNLHSKISLSQRDGTHVNEGKEVTAELNESTKNNVADNSTEHADSRRSESANNKNELAAQGEHRGKNEGENVESREQIQKVDNSKPKYRNTYPGERTDEDEGKNINKSLTGEALGMQENNNSAKAEAIMNHHREVQHPRSVINEGETTGDKGLQATGIGQQVETSNTRGAENKNSGSSYKGATKLEMPNSPQIGQHKLDGNGYLKKTKRKRWNIINRSKESKRNSVSNGAAGMRYKSFSKVTLEGARDGYKYQGELDGNKHDESLNVDNESGSEDHDKKISDNLQTGEGSKLEINEQVGLEHGEVQGDSGRRKAENNTEDSKDSQQGSGLLKPGKYQYAKDLSQEDRNTTTYLITEKSEITNDTNIITKTEHISLKDTTTKMTIPFEDETSSEAKQQNQSWPEELQKQATDFQQQEERMDHQNKEEASEQTETVNNDVDPENPEMEDTKETESDTEASRESTLNSKADGKLNSDGSNEPEFR